jgi:hypothetical protein
VDCLEAGNCGVVLQVGGLSGNWYLRCCVTGLWIDGTGDSGVVLQVGRLSGAGNSGMVLMFVGLSGDR